MVDYIHTYKKEICFGMSDMPRASMDLIRKVYSEGVAAGADKAGLFDTFGVASAATMKYLSTKVREIIPPR